MVRTKYETLNGCGETQKNRSRGRKFIGRGSKRNIGKVIKNNSERIFT